MLLLVIRNDFVCNNILNITFVGLCVIKVGVRSQMNKFEVPHDRIEVLVGILTSCSAMLSMRQ